MALSKEIMGERVKRARKLKEIRDGEKFTQSMLAAAIGKSQSYIGDIEAGRTYPSYPLLSKIAEACEVPLNFFDVEGFGNSIKEKRESLGLSIHEVAQQSGIGGETLEKLENNDPIRLTMEQWSNLGTALKYPNHDILQIFTDDLLYRMTQSDFDEPDKASLYVQGIYRLEQHSNKINEKIIETTVVNEGAPIEYDKIVKLPIIGSFAAGQPVVAIPEDNEYFPFDTKLARVEGKVIDDYFYLRVKGDSMEPNLRDGDIALVRRQPIVDNGQIAAVLCDGESVACKRISFANGSITLYSDNPQYPPMVFRNEQCLIIGRVIGHYRKDY